MTENVTLIGALVSLVIPVLVAFVTSRLANTTVKGITLLALSAANGFLLAWQVDPHYDWKKGAITTIYTFAVAVAIHFGLLKDTVTGKDGYVATRFPRGIGAPRGPAYAVHAPVSRDTATPATSAEAVSKVRRRRTGRR